MKSEHITRGGAVGKDFRGNATTGSAAIQRASVSATQRASEIVIGFNLNVTSQGGVEKELDGYFLWTKDL